MNRDLAKTVPNFRGGVGRRGARGGGGVARELLEQKPCQLFRDKKISLWPDSQQNSDILKIGQVYDSALC